MTGSGGALTISAGVFRMRRFGLAIMAVLLLATLGFSGDDKKDLPSSDISLVVTKVTNGKPIRNALVVLHSLDKDGNTGSGGVNLKTDSEGKTEYRGLPYGKVRVQVIAKGFQTYGEDVEIKEPTKTIEIKMNPPKDQYSIYK
jgi:hypothetical protein